jgi:hypothetical protein
MKLGNRIRALVAAGGFCVATVIGGPALNVSAAHPIALDGALSTSATAPQPARTSTGRPAGQASANGTPTVHRPHVGLCLVGTSGCVLPTSKPASAAVFCAKNVCSPRPPDIPVIVPLILPPGSAEAVKQAGYAASNPTSYTFDKVNTNTPSASLGGTCTVSASAADKLLSVCAKESGLVAHPNHFMNSPGTGPGGILPGNGCPEAGCDPSSGGYPDDAVWSRVPDSSQYQYWIHALEEETSSYPTHFNIYTQFQNGYGLYRDYHVVYEGYGQWFKGDPTNYWLFSSEESVQSGNPTALIWYADNYDGAYQDMPGAIGSQILNSPAPSQWEGVLDSTGDSNMFGEFFSQAEGDAEELGNAIMELVEAVGG